MQLLQCHISLTLSMFEENFAHSLERLNSFVFGNQLKLDQTVRLKVLKSPDQDESQLTVTAASSFSWRKAEEDEGGGGMSRLRKQVGLSTFSPATQILLLALCGTASTTALAASPGADLKIPVRALVE